MKEVAGGGTTTTVLCDETLTLWRKDSDLQPCPFSFPFSIPLPTTFSDEHGSWVRDSPLSPFRSWQHESMVANWILRACAPNHAHL